MKTYNILDKFGMQKKKALIYPGLLVSMLVGASFHEAAEATQTTFQNQPVQSERGDYYPEDNSELAKKLEYEYGTTPPSVEIPPKMTPAERFAGTTAVSQTCPIPGAPSTYNIGGGEVSKADLECLQRSQFSEKRDIKTMAKVLQKMLEESLRVPDHGPAINELYETLDNLRYRLDDLGGQVGEDIYSLRRELSDLASRPTGNPENDQDIATLREEFSKLEAELSENRNILNRVLTPVESAGAIEQLMEEIEFLKGEIERLRDAREKKDGDKIVKEEEKFRDLIRRIEDMERKLASGMDSIEQYKKEKYKLSSKRDVDDRDIDVEVSSKGKRSVRREKSGRGRKRTSHSGFPSETYGYQSFPGAGRSDTRIGDLMREISSLGERVRVLEQRSGSYSTSQSQFGGFSRPSSGGFSKPHTSQLSFNRLPQPQGELPPPPKDYGTTPTSVTAPPGTGPGLKPGAPTINDIFAHMQNDDPTNPTIPPTAPGSSVDSSHLEETIRRIMERLEILESSQGRTGGGEAFDDSQLKREINEIWNKLNQIESKTTGTGGVSISATNINDLKREIEEKFNRIYDMIGKIQPGVIPPQESDDAKIQALESRIEQLEREIRQVGSVKPAQVNINAIANQIEGRLLQKVENLVKQPSQGISSADVDRMIKAALVDFRTQINAYITAELAKFPQGAQTLDMSGDASQSVSGFDAKLKELRALIEGLDRENDDIDRKIKTFINTELNVWIKTSLEAMASKIRAFKSIIDDHERRIKVLEGLVKQLSAKQQPVVAKELATQFSAPTPVPSPAPVTVIKKPPVGGVKVLPDLPLKKLEVTTPAPTPTPASIPSPDPEPAAIPEVHLSTNERIIAKCKAEAIEFVANETCPALYGNKSESGYTPEECLRRSQIEGVDRVLSDESYSRFIACKEERLQHQNDPPLPVETRMLWKQVACSPGVANLKELYIKKEADLARSIPSAENKGFPVKERLSRICNASFQVAPEVGVETTTDPTTTTITSAPSTVIEAEPTRPPSPQIPIEQGAQPTVNQVFEQMQQEEGQ